MATSRLSHLCSFVKSRPFLVASSLLILALLLLLSPPILRLLSFFSPLLLSTLLCSLALLSFLPHSGGLSPFPPSPLPSSLPFPPSHPPYDFPPDELTWLEWLHNENFPLHPSSPLSPQDDVMHSRSESARNAEEGFALVLDHEATADEDCVESFFHQIRETHFCLRREMIVETDVSDAVAEIGTEVACAADDCYGGDDDSERLFRDRSERAGVTSDKMCAPDSCGGNDHSIPHHRNRRNLDVSSDNDHISAKETCVEESEISIVETFQACEIVRHVCTSTDESTDKRDTNSRHSGDGDETQVNRAESHNGSLQGDAGHKKSACLTTKEHVSIVSQDENDQRNVDLHEGDAEEGTLSNSGKAGACVSRLSENDEHSRAMHGKGQAVDASLDDDYRMNAPFGGLNNNAAEKLLSIIKSRGEQQSNGDFSLFAHDFIDRGFSPVVDGPVAVPGYSTESKIVDDPAAIAGYPMEREVHGKDELSTATKHLCVPSSVDVPIL